MDSKLSAALRGKYNDGDIVFLHIGKNAGTQVQHVTRQLEHYGIVVKSYGHRVKLFELPHDSQYFFSIRNPASRFVSGFYSRKRKGQPRLHNEWTPHEAIAFESFEHANELAENLFSTGAIGTRARQAIKSISHTGMQQYDWFERSASLEHRPPITIIRQEHFNKDMQRFLDLIGVEVDISTLTTADDVESHKNNYEDVPPLSDMAIQNLEKWYVQDYWFYEMCEAWLDK